MSQRRAKQRSQRSRPVVAGSDDAFGLPDLDVLHTDEFFDVLEAAGATVNRLDYSWSYPTSEKARIHAAVQSWWKDRGAV